MLRTHCQNLEVPLIPLARIPKVCHERRYRKLSSLAGGPHLLDRARNCAGIHALRAICHSNVCASYETGRNAVDLHDLVDVLNTLGVLDLKNDCGVFADLEVLFHRCQAVGAGTVRRRVSTSPCTVSGRLKDALGLVGIKDVRGKKPVRAHVENAENRRGAWIGNADEAW